MSVSDVSGSGPSTNVPCGTGTSNLGRAARPLSAVRADSGSDVVQMTP
jgi:hypothetical protein